MQPKLCMMQWLLLLFLGTIIDRGVAQPPCPSAKCFVQFSKASKICTGHNLQFGQNCIVTPCETGKKSAPNGWTCTSPISCPSRRCTPKLSKAMKACDKHNRRFNQNCIIVSCETGKKRKPLGWTCADARSKSSPAPTPSISVSPFPSMSASSTPSPTASTKPSRVNYFAINGIFCPPGMFPKDSYGAFCNLRRMIFYQAVGLVVRSPPNAICPRAGVGGGSARCRACGDGITRMRTVVLESDGNFGGNCDLQNRMLADWWEALLKVVTEDKIDLCTLDYEVGDGGSYVTQILPSKMEGILQDAFCRRISF